MYVVGTLFLAEALLVAKLIIGSITRRSPVLWLSPVSTESQDWRQSKYYGLVTSLDFWYLELLSMPVPAGKPPGTVLVIFWGPDQDMETSSKYTG